MWMADVVGSLVNQIKVNPRDLFFFVSDISPPPPARPLAWEGGGAGSPTIHNGPRHTSPSLHAGFHPPLSAPIFRHQFLFGCFQTGPPSDAPRLPTYAAVRRVSLLVFLLSPFPFAHPPRLLCPPESRHPPRDFAMITRPGPGRSFWVVATTSCALPTLWRAGVEEFSTFRVCSDNWG